MRTAPARLGELLEKRGQITREQLLRALRNQKVLGGRLGTCLLEIEALSEEQLCATLAEQYGMPCATPEDLRGIPEDVLEMLPAKVARRCHAVAFRASSTQVKVALIDARNLAHQDEISFVVGRRIHWHVAPELRVMEALEKHYGVECPSRFAKLLDKMNRSRFLWARDRSASTETAVPLRSADQLHWDTQIAGVSASAGQESASSISVELPHFQHAPLELPAVAVQGPPTSPGAAPKVRPAAAQPAAARPPKPAAGGRARAAETAPAQAPPKPADDSPAAAPAVAPPPITAETAPPSVEEIERRLLLPRGRDEVARAIVDFAAGVVGRAVLFVVRKEEVSAWMWTGSGLDADRLAALRFKLGEPSFLEGLREREPSFGGRLAPLPAHRAVAACFAKPPLAAEVRALPVRVKDRLVGALFFEPKSPAGGALAPSALANLERVISKAEIAFELCIMRTKLRQA